MKKIIVILFLVSAFLIGFLPVKDTDFGWHYRCGNQFITTGKLCLTNEFSYFLPNYKAYYSGHLYDIALALIYNHGGFLAISIVGSIIFLLSALIFFSLINSEAWISISAFFIIIFLSQPIFNLGLRPQIISYLFLLLLLYILNHKNSKSLFILPVFFLLWVNIHIGFFIGLLILFFYLLKQNRNNINPYLAIVLLSILATLINPFGINVYVEIFRHTTVPLNKMIAEWQPILWQSFLIIIMNIVLITIMIKNKTITLYQSLLLLFFGILVLNAHRNLPFFYTIFFIIAINNLKIKSRKFNGVLISLLSTLILLTIIIRVPVTIQHGTQWNIYCNNLITLSYPCAAIKKIPIRSGNIYASYEWGGFLIWQKPDAKVFVDGRMPAWRDENGISPYKVFLDIIQTQHGWNEKLNKWKTNYLLISNGTFLDLLLQKEAKKYGWQEKYRDNIAVIYKNKNLD